MKGTKAFPNGFGADSALMFAGSDGVKSAETSEASGTTVSLPAADAGPEPTAPEVPVQASADAGAFGQAWPKPTIRLGRRGFHFPPPPAQAGDGVTDPTDRQPPGILMPAILLGVLLAASSYFFNFPF